MLDRSFNAVLHLDQANVDLSAINLPRPYPGRWESQLTPPANHLSRPNTTRVSRALPIIVDISISTMIEKLIFGLDSLGKLGVISIIWQQPFSGPDKCRYDPCDASFSFSVPTKTQECRTVGNRLLCQPFNPFLAKLTPSLGLLM